MPGSTDKHQQNGPQKAASQTQESLIPASPHHPNRRKRAKPRNRKQPEHRSGWTKTQKHLPGALKTKQLEKLTAAIHFTGVIPGGSGVLATRGLCKNQMHHQRTNIIITPHQPPPPSARTEENIRDGFKACTRVRGSISAQTRPW